MLRRGPCSSILLPSLALALVACGPSIPGEPTLGDVEAHEVLAEHCGSTDPIRLLSLAPNERGSGPAPSRDGWVFRITVYDRELTQSDAVLPTSAEGSPQQVSSRIVWVDECGTDVRVVIEDTSPFRAPSGDEPWIACANQNVRSIPHGTLKGWWVHDDRLWTLGIMDDADPSRLGLLELAGPTSPLGSSPPTSGTRRDWPTDAC